MPHLDVKATHIKAPFFFFLPGAALFNLQQAGTEAVPLAYGALVLRFQVSVAGITVISVGAATDSVGEV